jgi:hypothetical protein
MSSPDDPSRTRIVDFATSTSPQDPHPTSPGTNVGREQLRVDTQSDSGEQRGRSASQLSATAAHADGTSVLSPTYSIDSNLRRRPTRSNTVHHYETPIHPLWDQPGAEPGVDTKKDDDLGNYYHLQQECEITVVDFSDERVEKTYLGNADLADFLKQPKEEWAQCRWISVNGLSWDVIRVLGNYKNLHRLAIEDLMNTRGRTKADWYSDQAFRKFCTFVPIESGHFFRSRQHCKSSDSFFALSQITRVMCVCKC